MKKLLLLLLAFSSFQLNAQEIGDPDFTFGVDGYSIIDFGYYDSSVSGQTIQPDGKIIVYGTYSTNAPGPSETWYPFLIRLNADGSIDQTFGTNGIINMTTCPLTFFDKITLTLMPDGKILTGGRHYAARFDQNGVIDDTFGTNGFVFPAFYYGYNVVIHVRSIILKPDESLLFSCMAEANPSYQTNFIYKYSADGVLQGSQSVSGFSTPNYVIPEESGTYLYGTTFTAPYTTSYSNYTIGRLDADFVTVSSVISSTMAQRLNAIIKTGNNGILINTSETLPPYTASMTYLYDSNFTLDTSFGNNGASMLYPKSKQIMQQGDTYLFLQENTTGITFFRSHLDGTLDDSFNNGSIQLQDTSDKYAATFNISDNRFVISGTINTDPAHRKIFVTKAYYTFGALTNPTFNKPTVRVFPNPANQFLNISLTGLKLLDIKLYDIQGRLINSESTNTNPYLLDISNIKAGTYLVKLTTNEGIDNVKFIKN